MASPVRRKPLTEFHKDRPTLNELLSGSPGICSVLRSEFVERTTDCKILSESQSIAQTVSEIFAQKGYNTAEFTIGRLENISIDSKLGVCVDKFGDLIEETTFVAEKIDPGLKTVPFVSNSPHTVQIVEGVVLHCFHRASPAYGHFIFDCLSPILFFKQEIQSRKLKVLIPSYFPEWIFSILAHLGIAGDMIVKTSADVAICKCALISSTMTTLNSFRPHPALSRLLTLLSEDSRIKKTKSRKIYLSRGNQVVYSKRSISNETELIGFLAKKDFDILEPANLSFADQIAAFRGADVIVSPHGSSLANIAMAKAGTVLIDLMPYDWIGLWPDNADAGRWGLHLTTLFRLHYILLLSPSARSSRGADHIDAITYNVGLNQIDAALEAANSLLATSGNDAERRW